MTGKQKKCLSNIPSDYLLQYGGRKKRDNHPEYYSHYEEDYYHNPHERDYQFYEDFSVDTIEDCFADIPAPRYGYVVRITYTRTGKLTTYFLYFASCKIEGFTSKSPRPASENYNSHDLLKS